MRSISFASSNALSLDSAARVCAGYPISATLTFDDEGHLIDFFSDDGSRFLTFWLARKAAPCRRGRP